MRTHPSTRFFSTRFFLVALSIAWMSCSAAKPKTAMPEASPDVDPAPTKPPKDPTAWRNTPPKVGKAPDVVIPTFEHTTLSNGLTVMVVNRPALPLVFVSLALKTGSAQDDKNAMGIADFTFEVMMEGAGKKDGVAIAEAFADLGARAGVRTSEDGAAFNALFLKKNLDAGLTLFSEILTRPTFKSSDVTRKQKERIADLQSYLGDPQYLSHIATAEKVYGKDHPYGHPVMGTLESVASFTPQKLKQFYKKHVLPQNTALILTGDITLADAVDIATKKLGSWRSAKQPEKVVFSRKNAEQLPPFAIQVVPQPGMNQTIISAGVVALPAGDPDEWALRVAIDAFIGMFGSRLNMNLREDKGYTYGARGRLSAMHLDGAVLLSTAVKGDVTGAALKEILAEFDALSSRPITEAEFHAATENVLKSVSGWFDRVSGLAGTARSLFVRDLSPDRYADMIAAYEKLTLEDVRKAVATYLTRSHLQVIMVGDPDLIKKQLTDYPLGEAAQLSINEPPNPSRPNRTAEQ